MFAVHEFTIPANTPRASPATDDMLLDLGVVTRVELTFPRGLGIAFLAAGESRPAGAQVLVGVQVHRAGAILYPRDPQQWISGDDITIAWQDEVLIDAAPFSWTLVGWNDDDTYPHTVTVRAQIERLDRAREERLLGRIIRRLGRLVLGEG